MLQPDTALIYTMVLMSAADGEMTDAELGGIGDSVRTLPAFAGYDDGRLAAEAEACADVLGGVDGLETVLNLIASALPAPCQLDSARLPTPSPVILQLLMPLLPKKRPDFWSSCAIGWAWID